MTKTAINVTELSFAPLTTDRWSDLERLFGAPAGRLLVALGFAAYHAPVLLRLYPLGPASIRFAGIVAAGIFWTWFAARRRSWGWVWWAHLAADAVIVIAFVLWVQP